MKATAKRVIIAAAGTLLLLPAFAQVGQLSVDASAITGAFRPLQGIASVPGPAPFPGLTDIPDATPLWHAAHVMRVRSWDWGDRLDTRDNPTSLFPHWAADPNNPASYNFTATDVWIKDVLGIGAEIQFTIGPDVPHNKLPATNLAKYQSVVEHIVRHYDQGWANGFHHAVRYWEFSDQPDLGQLHYAGTPDQFFAQYKAVTQAVKHVNPRLQVGGPGLAFPLNVNAPYREGFLAFVRTQHLPLDFFSFQAFSDTTRDPMDFTATGQDLRAVLDARGLKSTALVLDSWNLNAIPTSKQTPLEAAVFQTAAAIYMQDSVIDSAMLFRGDSGTDPFYHFIDPDRMFDHDPFSGPRSAAYMFTGQTLAMVQRLKLAGSTPSGFAALAGVDRDRSVVRILVVNYAMPPEFLKPRQHDYNEFRIPMGTLHVVLRYNLPPQRPDAASQGQNGYDLAVTDLPWSGSDSLVVRRRVDGSHNGEIVDSQRMTGASLHLAAQMPADSVELIEIRPISGASK